MVAVYNFYMDDSGTRHPDHQLSLESSMPDWFGLGGILVRDEQEDECRRMHANFCAHWGIVSPLHSEEIRHCKKNFRWLKDDKERRDSFLSNLQTMLLELPVVGISCAVDRRGYHRRYHAKYGKQKWSLCRSAFAISVERAGKFARERGCKLNVFVEKSDKKTDSQIRLYFGQMREFGHPFDQQNASKYAPLERAEFADTLYDLKFKGKESAMMQIADLYLYPMCRGGYDPLHYPYAMLRQSRRLLDAHVEDVEKLGIKYYCFEDVRKKTEAEDESPSASGQPSVEDLVG